MGNLMVTGLVELASCDLERVSGAAGGDDWCQTEMNPPSATDFLKNDVAGLLVGDHQLAPVEYVVW